MRIGQFAGGWRDDRLFIHDYPGVRLNGIADIVLTNECEWFDTTSRGKTGLAAEVYSDKHLAARVRRKRTQAKSERNEHLKVARASAVSGENRGRKVHNASQTSVLQIFGCSGDQ